MVGPQYSLTLDGRRITVDWNELVAMARGGRLTAVNTVTTPSGAQVLAHDIPGLFASGTASQPEAPPVIQPTAPPTMEAQSRFYARPQGVDTRKKNSTVMIALIVLGVLGFGCCLSVLWPVFEGARSSSGQVLGISNVTQISLGTIMYTTDWDDRFPPSMASALAVKPYIMPYSKDATIFEELNPLGGQILGDRRLKEIESTTLLHPESDVMFYDEHDWPGGYVIVGFADGHAKGNFLRREVIADLAVPLALTKPSPGSESGPDRSPISPTKAKRV